MASKKKTEPAAAEPIQTAPPPTRKTRTAAVIQPDLAVEIEQCKKRIFSLKSLNKLTPVIDGMDLDALTALEKIITTRKDAIAASSEQ